MYTMDNPSYVGNRGGTLYPQGRTPGTQRDFGIRDRDLSSHPLLLLLHTHLNGYDFMEIPF